MGYPVKEDSNNAQKAHVGEASTSQEVLYMAFSHNQSKDPKLVGSNLTFIERKAHKLLHPHVNALVVILIVVI